MELLRAFRKIQCKLHNDHIMNIKRTAVDLAYQTYGPMPPDSNKIPIIVCHGLLGSKRNWASVSGKLASALQTTVLTIDARNHGESPWTDTHSYLDLADDLHQFIKKHSFPKVNLIGHSMGGRTCMVFTLQQPSIVASLIPVDISTTSIRSLSDNFFLELLTTLKTVDFEGLTNTAQARDKARKKIVESGLMDVNGAAFLLMNIVQKNNKIQWQINVDTIKNSLTSIYTFPSEVNGLKYEGPVLCIAGGASDFVPKGDIVKIREYFPNAEITYIPNVGHNVHAEDPTSFLKTAQDFYLKLLLK